MKDIKHFCKIFEYALSITANIRCLAALFTIAAFLAACQPNSTTTAPEPSLTQPAQPNPKSTSPHSQLIKELTETVELAIKTGIDADEFQTGSKRFNSEWAAGSYQMAVLGMGQRIIANPELKPLLLPLMEKAIAQLLTPKLNQFGTDAWQEEGLTTLNANNGHAYLGYTNLALSMLRFIEPKNQFADMSDSLTQALVQRTIAAPHAILETYPNEAYPVDHAAVLASIALHEQALNRTEHQELLRSQVRHFSEHFVDSNSGLVYQAVDATTGTATDLPRASGTALAVYFLSFIELDTSLELSEQLFTALINHQKTQRMGFSGILEYPRGTIGIGDVDSGELIEGVSPSATMFAIAGAQTFQASALTQDLLQSIQFFRNPPSFLTAQLSSSLSSHFDGPLDEAILLAMLTSRPQPTRMPIE